MLFSGRPQNQAADQMTDVANACSVLHGFPFPPSVTFQICTWKHRYVSDRFIPLYTDTSFFFLCPYNILWE